MNIKKTNSIGISLIEARFNSLSRVKKTIVERDANIGKARLNDMDRNDFIDSNKGTLARMTVFDFQKDHKVLRVSKNIIELCKLINIDSIKDNIDVNELDFSSLTILLDNDISGLIKIQRFGSDFDFLYLKNLVNLEDVFFDSYSFLTKEFNFYNDREDSLFVVKLLAYLYYGDITTKLIPAKSEVKLSIINKIQNNSNVNISFVDSLWKQRISTEGFKVKGHFRLQPIGVERKKRKLIWIEEFQKDGYNRKATRENL